MTSLPSQLLPHLEYLRSLHLEAPRLGNPYLQDRALREYIEPQLGSNHPFGQVLTGLGDNFSTKYTQAARHAEQNQPRLQQFDSYGRRIDKLHLSEGWQLQKKYAAEDGIVAMAYEQDRHGLGNLQRFGQLVSLYMYHPSSGLYGCPLAMTDGAAYTIRHLLQGDKLSGQNRALLQDAYDHLTSRKDMWTSGQWMTEKKGGSDVSNTETIAVLDKQTGSYRLYGYKWFTSATDSQMSLGLAKILPEGVKPTAENLSKIPVSLFFIKLRNQDGLLNNMQIIRLKDKLGTRQLPTAELLLKGTTAHLVSDPKQGVKVISRMLTITRIYNSATAVGLMARGLALARDYASRRTIGTTKLSDMPLQLRVLSHLDVVHRGNLMLYLRVCAMFSREHHNVIQPHEANLLRVMVPLTKLFTAKESIAFLSQILESFGGMGYIEGSMLPSMLRDAQVLSIWEGTTNVLCYDFVRALMKKQNEHTPMESLAYYFSKSFEHFKQLAVDDKKITRIHSQLIESYTALFKDLNSALKSRFQGHFAQLRAYCLGLTRLYIAVELLSHAYTSMRQVDIEILQRWINLGLYTRQGYTGEMDKKLGLSLDEQGRPACFGDADGRGMPRSRL